tara:strand:- start:13 stop:429 length:417 start_codon:yes stop_codon:yes gene_type:complete
MISQLGLAQANSDKQQLKTLISESFDKIFSEKETDAMPNYYTKDFLLLEHGEVWDRQKITEMVQMTNDDPSERINSFDFVEIKVSGDIAWIVYHNTAIFKKEGSKIFEMKWLESATAVKTKDGWKLDMLHSTRKLQTK